MEQLTAPHLDILAMVETHLASSGMSKSAFGIAAVGDPCLVDDLRAGREPRRRTVARIMEFMLTGEQYDAARHSRRRKGDA